MTAMTLRRRSAWWGDVSDVGEFMPCLLVKRVHWTSKMIFKQYENVSCDIEFSKEEIKILNEKGKIPLSDEALRHFGNKLVQMVSDWNLKFNEELKNKMTFNDTKIKGK
jgi:hypothetical protein